MERLPLALLTTLAALALPAAAAQAAPVKIGPKPASVSGSTATIEVANPNRRVLRGTATVTAGAKTVARRAVKLPKVSVVAVKLRFDAKGADALRAANGRATVKLALLRAGGRKTTARRTLTIRLAAAGGPTLTGGAYCTALSFEPFVVAGPWTLGTDGSVQQSGIATNQLVSSGSRAITYTLKESAQTAGKVTGKLGMSYFDSKYDFITNKVWFVNCSGSQSFEAIPA